MRYILIIIGVLLGGTLKAQFTGTDSLRNYNNRYITNNPATAFTNLRLHTLLRGMIDYIDTARAGTGGGGAVGVDTLWALNDSTVRYRKNGVFRNFVLKGVYDTRRKVDTMYRVNDTTVGFTINHTARTFIIPGRYYVDSIYRKNGQDSIYYRKEGVEYAIKDSSGVSGITELTGDVTAGPGSGSQVATIANNAVTNGKLAQAPAFSVKGNAFNTTDDVGDILALNDHSVLRRNGTTINFGAINLNSPQAVTGVLPVGNTDTSSTNHLVTQSDLNDAIGGVTSGINQLTGDVTAGPGSGSQAATIASNAVSNAKLRQSAGVSVVGRSANSTGNVADITSTTAGTYLKRASTTVGWDSVDYADVKNKPDLQNPGVYFSPAESFDPSFVVFASAIPRITSTFTHGNPIVYEILDQATQHNSSFYDSIWGDVVTERLKVRFPPVKNVLNNKLNNDELMAQNGVFVGPSTATDGSLSPVYQIRSAGIRLNGDGAGNWTTNALFGTASSFSASAFNTSDGGTSFDWGFTNYDPDQIGIQYIGPNNYRIKRVYSGLGIYTVRFILIDEFGNPVTSNPTTADEILITNAGMQSRQVQMATYGNGNNNFLTGFANFWIDGAFECWLVAAPTSSTSITVRWQPTYPTATNYKIYRATSLYGSRTLIHTGTSGSYVDSGLSSGTLYWYFMIAVVSGVDTEITYFRTSTKAF